MDGLKTKLKPLLSGYKGRVWLPLILMALFAIEMGCFAWQTGYVANNAAKTALLWLLDATVLWLPALVIGRRTRWLMIAEAWVIALFLLAHSMYCRFFGDFMPPYVVKLAGTVGELVIDSVAARFEWLDIVYLLVPALSTVVIAYWPLKPLSRRGVAGVWMAVLAAILATQVISFRAYHSYRCSFNQGVRPAHTLWEMYSNSPVPPKSRMILLGLPAYMGHYFTIGMWGGDERIDLTPELTERIEGYLAGCDAPSPLPDKAFTANQRKNLIFIIVESFNSWTVGYRIGDFLLTPTVNSLMEQEGTISNLNVYSQVGNGGSSDGQFIYNTGLLPLRDYIVAQTFTDVTYPTLAKVFGDKGYRSVEVICEDPAVWNHALTTRMYGYDQLYSKNDITDSGLDFDALGYDQALFKYCEALIDTLPQPFLLEATTLSMHIPYDIKGFTIPGPIAADKRLSDAEKRYLANTYYFDRELGRFLKALQAKGLSDNTIVVLASDHNYKIGDIDGLSKSAPVVFMALNTGLTRRLTDVAAQVDVFPTVVDIMGASSNWRGLGHSMLRPGGSGAVTFDGEVKGAASPDVLNRIRDAWSISDLISKGDYFHNISGQKEMMR